jgi:hypothetical protein
MTLMFKNIKVMPTTSVMRCDDVVMITFLLPSISLIIADITLQISPLIRKGSIEKNVFVSKHPAESTADERVSRKQEEAAEAEKC